LDINVLSAWDKYTGKGIIVAVNDDGMDLTHPALLPNMLVNLAFDSTRNTTGQGFGEMKDGNAHGTVVGSIVAMPGNDGVGGVGVAYEAKLVPGRVLGEGANSANQFLANLASGASVSVNSWGKDPAFSDIFTPNGSAEDQAWGAALLRATSEARNGLGMVIEVSGGNERATRADVAMTNFTGSRLIIAVGAVTETGVPTSYSSQGASLLVTAPGGVAGPDTAVDTGFGIPSADVQGDAGYNKTAGAAGDYAYQNEGTSYSGPMVGGAAALMLQADPTLGFRDVSNILAMTARKVDPTNTSWVQTHATDWNGGGMHFSRDFGFGLLDVSAAVRLAESWYLPAGTMANWQSAEGVSATAKAEIPDDSTFFTVTADVAKNVRIERMEFDLNLTSTSPAQLSATITSPSGTTITLFDIPNVGTDVPAWPGTFTIGVTGFFGESSAGTWTLKLLDSVTGVVASYNSLTVRAWGSAITANTQIILTNEFAAANSTLADPSGTDTLNAAATATAVTLDLTAGNKSTAGTGSFSIALGTVIENAIGGLGDDTLTGNEVDNILRGNGGSDALDGGAGTDSALFTGKRADYTITPDGQGSYTVVSATEGTDTLKNMEIAMFSDQNITLSTIAAPGAGQTITGTAANDALAGGTGNDTIDGLAGLDTFSFTSNLAANTLTQTTPATSTEVAHYSISGPAGVDALASIERLHFTDINVAFDLNTNAGQVYRLYQAAFNRTPDVGGLGGWIAARDGGMDLPTISGKFMESAEFTGLYGSTTTNDQFVKLLYVNALRRPADAGGLAGWVDDLASGRQTRAQVLVNFSESGENKAGVLPAISSGIYYATSEQAAGPAKGQTFAGTANADGFIGTVGNDTFNGGAGDDSINAGRGIDVAIRSGERASHTVSRTDTGLTVMGGTDGTDVMTGLERLRFDDAILAFDTSGNAGQTYRLYQAAFNRTPDKAGLTDWVRGMDGGTTLTQVARGFIASTEFQNLMGASPTDKQFVNQLYTNVLRRPADADGEAYWLNQLQAGTTREAVLIGFSESNENQVALIGVIQNGIELLSAS
jgi:subtilisin-like proprotein convertase family protein